MSDGLRTYDEWRDLKTYDQWKAEGFQVLRGQKATILTGRPVFSRWQVVPAGCVRYGEVEQAEEEMYQGDWDGWHGQDGEGPW